MGDDVGRDRDRVPAVLDLEHVFTALAHQRRRYLLYTLTVDAEWPLWELAGKVAAWERDVAEEELAEEAVQRVYVSLMHGHVPKLVEDEIVEFDEASETIRPGPNAEQVLSVLESAGGSHDSQQETHARRDRSEGHSRP